MPAGARRRAPPGPLGPPVLGNVVAFRRDRLAYLRRVATEHGDLADVAVGPRPVVLASHPELVHRVLVDDADAYAKSPVLQQARTVLGQGLLTSEGALHRRQRRLVQPALTARRVADHAALMDTVAAGRARAWPDGGIVDVYAEMLQVSVQVVGRALLGVDVGGHARALHDAVDDVLAAYDLLLLPGGRTLAKLPLPAVRRLRRGLASLDALVADVVSRRRGALGDDLLSQLLADTDMSPRQLRDEVVTLLLAGHETTASAMTWALWLLAGDARTQADVAVEAGADDAAASRQRAGLVGAALAETLRLFPPSWAMGRQALEDVELGGHRVGAGTMVVTSQWVVQRDRRWWSEPDRFLPARWLDGEAPPAGAYFPFGLGARRCVGETFALAEAGAVLRAVLGRWRLSRAPGHAVRPSARLTLRPDGPVPLRVQTR